MEPVSLVTLRTHGGKEMWFAFDVSEAKRMAAHILRTAKMTAEDERAVGMLFYNAEHSGLISDLMMDLQVHFAAAYRPHETPYKFDPSKLEAQMEGRMAEALALARKLVTDLGNEARNNPISLTD